jgi:hypothetical protein
VDPLHRLRKTLRTHYRRKRERYALDSGGVYDRDLRRIFSEAPEHASSLTAVSFLSRIRREVRRLVRQWTGVYQYTIDQVFGEILERCRELGLRLAVSEEQAKLEFTVLLTVQTLKALHDGRLRLAL